jgi:chemotaxis protein MotA
MDIATLIGLILGPALLLWSMIADGSPLKMFVDYPSVAIVGGGALCSALLSFPMRELLGIHQVTKHTLFTKPRDPHELIGELVRYAEVARREGILALEHAVRGHDDEFLVSGVKMVVDGAEPAVIESMLESELDAIEARHASGKALWENIGKYAPAFGMIGTLIGLVKMLANMSDPSQIGAGMAVALLTTLYGAFISNLVALPFAEKLARRSSEEIFIKQIVLRGVLAIQAGDNPRIVEQKLKTYLPVANRVTSIGLAAA